MTDHDLQRWSREVAEDPGAPSFVLLARAYRRQGRRGAARDVVLGGLAANPEHVDAHSLLALIHIEDGDRQQARDEWETVLRLDPGSFSASRGLGFLALERGDLAAARRHLDAAAAARPDDPAVSQARQVLDRREAEASRPRPPEPATPARTGTGAAQPGGPVRGGDPVALFAPLATEAPFRGALLIDDRGLVLAGRLEEDDRPDDLLGALLSTAVVEARRTAEMLRLGSWGGMQLETEQAMLHVTALSRGAVLVVVAERDAPAGWVARTAERARGLAAAYVEEGS
jgi:predicted regulator of Ras-like GTPase activity (Roadblock/LC7/MglB family)